MEKSKVSTIYRTPFLERVREEKNILSNTAKKELN